MALFAGSNEFVLRVTTDKNKSQQSNENHFAGIYSVISLKYYLQVNNRTFLYIFLRSGTDS